MTQLEKCIELSEDYADRAAHAGVNYDDAYAGYIGRCINRSEKVVTKEWRCVFNIKEYPAILNLLD